MPSYVPNFTAYDGTCSKHEGGFAVLSQQSESANSRPDPAGQNGAVVDQAAAPSSAGERHGAETSATGHKATGGPRRHWLDYATSFLTLAAAGGAITAAVFTGWQAVTADQGMRASNRAYVHSTSFRFVHYGAKNENGRVQWSVSPLIDNTGNTGTREMLMTSIISPAGEPDFDALEKAEFAPALILPKSEMTGAVAAMDGHALDLLRGGGLITMGILKYADIFGDLHLVEFCHRAQFGAIDWDRPRRSAVAHSRPRLRDAQLRRQRVRSGLAGACHGGRKPAARGKRHAPRGGRRRPALTIGRATV
jgi:hypothetical protein